jgi:hypothetical protein
MPSKWIEHIKQYAKSNGMTYKDAMKCDKCKASYKQASYKQGYLGKGGASSVPSAEEQDRETERYLNRLRQEARQQDRLEKMVNNTITQILNSDMSTPHKQQKLSRLLFIVDEEGRRTQTDTTNMLRSINTVQNQLLRYVDYPIAQSESDPI